MYEKIICQKKYNTGTMTNTSTVRAPLYLTRGLSCHWLNLKFGLSEKHTKICTMLYLVNVQSVRKIFFQILCVSQKVRTLVTFIFDICLSLVWQQFCELTLKKGLMSFKDDKRLRLEEPLKFIYSEKATKVCDIFTLLLTGTT